MSLISRDLYRFGDFELQPSRHTLLRGGEKVALAPKTFEVFVCLVSRAGEVVLKEELFKEVWPESFVEESNLTQHIFWIRKALADKAEYVVTIPGRGYQFTAPVRVVSEAEQAEESAPQPNLDIKFQHNTELTHIMMEESTTIASPARFARREHWHLRLTIVASALAVFGLAAWGAWHWQHRPIPGDHHEVVLADFENTTGDPDFEPALKTLLSMDLNQSPYLVVADEADTRKALKLMGHSDDNSLPPAVAREVCERLNDQVVLSGLIARFGQKYLITLTATDCSDDKDLLRAKALADNREGVLKAVDSVAADMRGRLGESLKSRPNSAQPLQMAHTFSLDALRAYSQALALFSRGKHEEALPLYQRAIELDPRFAAAYLGLARCYGELHEDKLSRIAMTKAYELRNQSDEFLRLTIILAYNDTVTGDSRALLAGSTELAELYPNQADSWINLAFYQNDLGRPDLAIESARKAIALAPNNGDAYVALSNALVDANDLEAAKATCREAIRRRIDNSQVHGNLYAIAFAQHDSSAVKEQIAWSKGTEEEGMLLRYSLFAEGKAHLAVATWLNFIERFRRDGYEERADRWFRILLRGEAEVGMNSELRKQLPSVDPRKYPDALIIANAEFGNIAAAESGLNALASTMGSDSDERYKSYPEGKAAIALARHRPEAAIAALEESKPYDLKGAQPTYMRGLAYLAARRPALAEAEFRKIIAHAISATLPDGPLSHLGLARAYEMEDNHAASRQEYQIFFELWKDADVDLPVLIQARREYIHLPK